MKKSLLIGSVLLLASALAAAWMWGRPAYRHHKEIRSVARAKIFFDKKEFGEASLSARQALLINSNNVEACRIMAALAELVRSPMLIEWRERVADLEPTLDNKLLVASAGLRSQPPPYFAAARALEEVAASASNSVSFHVVAAELALKLKQNSKAEKHFIAAAALEPTNQLHTLNLSVLRLGSTSTSIAREARESLRAFATDPKLGVIALRWLVGDATDRGDNENALAFSHQLITTPGASLDDELHHLDALRKARSATLETHLTSLQRRYSSSAPDIGALANWMCANGFADDALAWLTRLPESVRTQQPLPVSINDCYVTKGDWRSVEKFLTGQQWKDLDFLRHAYLSRAAENNGGTIARAGHWRSAALEAGGHLTALNILLNLAIKWERVDEQEDLLWRIVSRWPGEKWVYRELERHYATHPSTIGLNRLYSALLNISPTNSVLKNNLAATSLLLKANLTQAHDLADQLFKANPRDPMIASTYAYSMLLRGKTSEGLAALEQLPTDQLNIPPVALYHGILLQSSGRMNEAANALEIAARSPDALLPEEKILLRNARR